MFPNSPFAHPVPSFQRPVPLVGTDPDQDPLICVSFNASYLPYILGALKQLILQSTWDTNDMNALNLQQMRINDLFVIFGSAQPCDSPCTNAGIGGDFMPLIRQNPTNNCILEGSFDNITWVTIFDASKCANFGTNPGTGTSQPKPGGGTSKNCYTLNANSILNLGTPVNTGDVITLDVSGSGWDGTESDFGPLWRCPDGEQFVAGACIGFAHTSSGDPVPTANHMSTIISLNGTFYSIMPGVPFAVPSGVTNITPFIQVNDSNIADNQGSYNVCVTITNNATPTWSQSFLNGQGNGSSPHPMWSAYVYESATATYDSSSDTWQGGASPTIPAENDKALGIKLTIPSGSTITRVTATCTLQSTNPVGALAQQVLIASTVEATQNYGTDSSVHTFTLDTGTISVPGSAEIDITMSVRGLVANGVPICQVDAITIYGSGANPFA